MMIVIQIVILLTVMVSEIDKSNCSNDNDNGDRNNG